MSQAEYFLGIHIGHDCNVTAMDSDGSVLFAAGEERFNRKKMYAGFPEQSLNYVLEKYGRNVMCLATARMQMRKKISRELVFFFSSFIYGGAAPRVGIWLKDGLQKLVAGRSLETRVVGTGIEPEWVVANGEHRKTNAPGAFYQC
ncbi:hypothetical protein K8T06_00545, partial [bacterium]|nr:hypothetical protein [bacterium]